ncbi:MAG: hydrogenase maturation protease [Synechococcales cyanobacterium T60_A2020_003]|nr:hydrogenase maturation protease [Synechococcales cyanobacterium T60_A2020_003]
MRALVIGYGNRLRGDDGVGTTIAEIVETWQFPGVGAIAPHQLTPELADSLSQVDMAFFVDASWDLPAGEVSVTPVYSMEHELIVSHYATPSGLLSLARSLYGCAPDAWWVQIGIKDTALGERFSTPVERAIPVALEKVRSHLERMSPIATSQR